MTQTKFGMALGSGGARGYCHIGVLEVLAEHGYSPSAISGSSMGALVGAAQAAGKLPELHRWAESIGIVKYAQLLDVRPFSGGLIGGKVIERVFEEVGLPDRIEDLSIPFACVATELETGAELWFREGPLFPAVRASMALPGVLSPVCHEGRWFVDGGMTNPVPVDLCQGMITGPVIGVTPAARTNRTKRKLTADTVPSYVMTMQASFEIMLEAIRRGRGAANPARISVDCGVLDITAMDFHKAKEVIALGRTAAQARIAEIKDVLG